MKFWEQFGGWFAAVAIVGAGLFCVWLYFRFCMANPEYREDALESQRARVLGYTYVKVKK